MNMEGIDMFIVFADVDMADGSGGGPPDFAALFEAGSNPIFLGHSPHIDLNNRNSNTNHPRTSSRVTSRSSAEVECTTRIFCISPTKLPTDCVFFGTSYEYALLIHMYVCSETSVA